MTKERYRIASELWNVDIKTEILYNENPRMDKQMDYAKDNRIPFIIFIGENEIKDKKIKLKCMANGKEYMFNRDTYIQEIQELKKNHNLLIFEQKIKADK